MDVPDCGDGFQLLIPSPTIPISTFPLLVVFNVTDGFAEVVAVPVALSKRDV